MVAVNTRTLLAISLASLSLVPSADSLAIKTPSSSSSSPSKQARQQQPRTAPMPMKLATKDTGKHKKLGGPVKGYNHKSRVVGGDSQLGETVSRRQQGQARFDVNRVTRGHFEARQDPQMPGQAGTIAIMSPNGNSSDSTTNGTVLGHLFLSLSNTTTPSYVLDASQNNSTTFFMVPSNNSRVTLQLAFDVDNNATARRAIVPFCATYNPDPPAPQPLTMEECGNPSTAGGSQQFQFNNGTGILQPLWYTSNNGTATAPNMNDDSAADSDSDDDTLNSRDVSPQNVNLVFVPIAAPGQAAEEEVSPSSAQIDTVTVTVTSTASSLAGSASPMMDSSSQSASYPPDRVISTTSASSAAAASFAAADVDVASSSTYITSSPAASSPTGSFIVSTTSSDLAPSFAAAQVDAVSSTSMAVPSMPTSSSDDSAASTVGALDVEVGSSSSMDGPSSSAFFTGTPSSSSASGAPSASTSVDAATIAAEIANGGTSSSYPAASLSSGSASSSAPSPSSSADVVVPPTTDSEQAVYVENPAEMMAMRTEPYQWKFSPEPRL